MSNATKQIRTVWAKEISKELAETRSALKVVDAEHAAADAVALETGTAHREHEDALSPIEEEQAGFPIESLAGPLAIRLHDLRTKAKAADAHRAQAHNARQQLIARISELELALSQIDRLTGGSEVSA